MKLLRTIFLIFCLLMLVAGCVTNKYSEENLAPLGPALTKLCFAVEACIRGDNPPAAGMSDDLILKKCTDYDPTLLEPFRGYNIKVLRQSGRVVLLVCNQNNTMGLLEDACCTGRLEKRTWKETSEQPCQFTISLDDVCPTKNK